MYPLYQLSAFLHCTRGEKLRNVPSAIIPVGLCQLCEVDLKKKETEKFMEACEFIIKELVY